MADAATGTWEEADPEPRWTALPKERRYSSQGGARQGSTHRPCSSLVPSVGLYQGWAWPGIGGSSQIRSPALWIKDPFLNMVQHPQSVMHKHRAPLKQLHPHHLPRDRGRRAVGVLSFLLFSHLFSSSPPISPSCFIPQAILFYHRPFLTLCPSP